MRKSVLIAIILSLASFGLYFPLITNASTPPSLNIVLAPSEINHNNSSSLLWSSSNADSCTVSGPNINLSSKSGTRTVKPSGTAVYTITCINSFGTNSASATLTVIAEPNPSVSISAIPFNIEEGGSAILRWNATNADSCVASGDWTGSKGSSGTVSVRPKVSTVYFLTCINSIGSASDNASITVARPLPSITINTSKTNVRAGEAVTIVWDAKNSNSCSASGGWFGPVSFSGSRVVNPQQTTTFSIVCTNNTTSVSASKTVSVSSSGSVGNPQANLPISSGDFSAVCSVFPAAVSVGQEINFFGTHSGGVEPVNYRWSGDIHGSRNNRTTYFTAEGPKIITLTVTDAQNRQAVTTCTTQVFTISQGGSNQPSENNKSQEPVTLSERLSGIFGFSLSRQDQNATQTENEKGESLLAAAITPKTLINVIWYSFLIALNIVLVGIFIYSTWALNKEIKLLFMPEPKSP